MDLNELFRRHQLALINFIKSQSPSARQAAARMADDFAAQIQQKRPARAKDHIVLSSRTYETLSSHST